MPSTPPTRPTHRPGIPDHPVRGVTPGSRSPATESAPRTKPDVPDAAAAEPVPHEHLPSRSDDN
ncbi:hypothetical protein E2553_01885 [Paraburkholderia dipogonis]|uniref:Uncharacterized protein n=1 Tax=Paraburkholderia dipogonis TaxID=1211383 RepID=A0A4Y8N2E7_9BURK|nr:hypothetical protein E2553_01885 [Paraburkholderia dipogonis]